MSKFGVTLLGTILVGVTLVLAIEINSCSSGSVRLVSKRNVEDAHGLKLPPSARNHQHRRGGKLMLGNKGYFDRGILSLFEIESNAVREFTAQLRIKSRTAPVVAGIGDPCQNGWNVWPTDAPTFVPGDEALRGLQRTWLGDAKPIEMLSCDSPKGSWLHVEIWSTGDRCLIKLYTDWN